MKLKLFYLIVFFINFQVILAQVGINNSNPHNSSVLDIQSSNKGVLIPKVELNNLNNQAPIPVGISPSESLLVYNTSIANGLVEGFYYWSGIQWINLVDESVPQTNSIPWVDISDLTPTATNIGDIYHKGSVSISDNRVFGKFFAVTESADNTESAHFTKISTVASDAINLRFLRGRGNSYDDAAIVQNNDVLGTFNYQVVGGRSGGLPVWLTAGSIQAVANGTVSATSAPGKLQFYVERYTTNDNPELKMEISRSGKITFNRHSSWRTDNSVTKILGIDTNGNFKVINKSTLAPPSINTLNHLGNGVYLFKNSATGESFYAQKRNQLKYNFNNGFTLADKLVVGSDNTVIGNSNNSLATVTIHSDDDNKYLSSLMIENCPVYASNDEAIKAGEMEGAIYRSPKGKLMIVSINLK